MAWWGMPLFIATQTSPPADHDITDEVTRMIANAADEAAATKLFEGLAQPGHTIKLTDDAPDLAWVQKQQQAGKLLPGMVMNYSAPLK